MIVTFKLQRMKGDRRDVSEDEFNAQNEKCKYFLFADDTTEFRFQHFMTYNTHKF